MKRYKNDRLMIFGDTHIPYQDEGMFDFLSETKRRFKPDRIVCVGDIVDFYNASRYPKSPNHPDSFINEIKKIHRDIKTLKKIFPEMQLTMGNHDDRFALKLSSAGIPSASMGSFGDYINAPSKWKIYRSTENLNLTVDATREQITFAHNRGINTYLVAQRYGRTFVGGHSHTKGCVVGYNNGLRTIFGVNNPCLISNEGSPFAYAKVSNINPVRGCTLIEEGIPRLVMI